jgi:hypothetical protein
MKDPRVNGVRATRPKCVVVPRGDDVCHTRELALRQPGLGRLAGIAAFEDLNRRPPPFSIVRKIRSLRTELGEKSS